MEEPCRAETDHATVGLGEELAGGLVVGEVGLKGAVDPPPVDPADQGAVVDPLRRGLLGIGRAEATLEAVAEVLHAQQLDGAVVLVGEQVDDPTGRYGQRIERGGGIERQPVVEQWDKRGRNDIHREHRPEETRGSVRTTVAERVDCRGGMSAHQLGCGEGVA